jgi:hypothetical protein
MHRIIILGALALSLIGTRHAAASPWAFEVIRYDATGATPGYTDAATALGAPSTDTGFGDVSLINPPFSTAQLVSIGVGGELVVRFESPVTDDPDNPFGLDLIVFGNAFFTHPGTGIIDGFFDADLATIAVSADDVTWHDLPVVAADGLFPTNAFVDTSPPTGFDNASDGTVLSDFTRPVDPSLTAGDFTGLGFAAAVALYAGSGGGTGVDISSTGLSSIEYVRITAGASTAEIDAFADVASAPEPAAAGLILLGVLAVGRRVLGARR